jgi:peptidoglycan/LPS O-acetylase OafA/YrhL
LALTGTVSPGRFLVRRGFKIYPAFWLLILATVITQLILAGRVNLAAWSAELLFYQNYTAGLWPHTWTLAVEEHFYLILAALFWALKCFPGSGGKVNLKIIPRVVSVVLLSCLAARILTWWFSEGINGDNQRWFRSVTHVRMDSLFFGVALAYWWYHGSDELKRARVRSLWYVWMAAGLVLLSPISEQLMEVETWHIWGFIVLYAGAGCLLLAALSSDNCRRPGWIRGPAWLGRHSYSVYLWHLLVLRWMQSLLGGAASSTAVFWVKGLIYFAASWIFGIILARMVEIPMLRLRDRLFPARHRDSNEQNIVPQSAQL